VRRRGDKWTDAEAALLRELAAAGVSRAEAARRLGRHPSTVSVRVRRDGLHWTPPARNPTPERLARAQPSWRPWTDEDDDLLKQLAAEGIPIGIAANQMDRAYNTALKHAKRLGLNFQRDRLSRQRRKLPPEGAT
jgi:transposase-like protein